MLGATLSDSDQWELEDYQTFLVPSSELDLSALRGGHDIEAIRCMHALAKAGNLLNYLTFFRLIPKPSLEILLEHLLVCYNRFDVRQIDFVDVEERLRELARQPCIDENELEQVMTIYFDKVRARIDGPDRVQSAMERFFSSFNDATLWSPSLIGGVAIPLLLLSVAALFTR